MAEHQAAHTSFNEIGADGYGNESRSSKSRALSSAATVSLAKKAKATKVDDDDADDTASWGALSMDEIHHLIMTQLSVGPEVAGPALTLRRSSTYRACRPNGSIPARKIGNKFVIATSWLREVLGLELTSKPAAASLPENKIVSAPTGPKQVTRPKRRRRR